MGMILPKISVFLTLLTPLQICRNFFIFAVIKQFYLSSSLHNCTQCNRNTALIKAFGLLQYGISVRMCLKLISDKCFFFVFLATNSETIFMILLHLLRYQFILRYQTCYPFTQSIWQDIATQNFK